MTAAAAIRLSASERWLGTAAPIGRVSRTMALVAAASFLGHVLVVGTLGVGGRTVVPPPAEIAVEVVQEVPKPTPEPEAKRPEPAPAKAELPKPEPPKPEPPKPEPPKPEPAKAEPPKAEPAKPEPEPPKPRPTRTRVAKAEPPAPARPAPPPARETAAEERKLAALQQELESLKAEQAALRAERAAEAATPSPVALRDTGLGLLPGSFQAVALPNTTDGAGEAASYEALVFSALAKAKGIGRRQGVPGTAGVRFSVDASGRLVAVELVHWSGIPELDSEALAVVRRAAFPPPPQGAQRTFVANVNFEVRAP